MNEGAREANAARDRNTARWLADNQANRERAMLDKLDRIIELLETLSERPLHVQISPPVEVLRKP